MNTKFVEKTFVEVLEISELQDKDIHLEAFERTKTKKELADERLDQLSNLELLNFLICPISDEQSKQCDVVAWEGDEIELLDCSFLVYGWWGNPKTGVGMDVTDMLRKKQEDSYLRFRVNTSVLGTVKKCGKKARKMCRIKYQPKKVKNASEEKLPIAERSGCCSSVSWEIQGSALIMWKKNCCSEVQQQVDLRIIDEVSLLKPRALSYILKFCCCGFHKKPLSGCGWDCDCSDAQILVKYAKEQTMLIDNIGRPDFMMKEILTRSEIAKLGPQRIVMDYEP